MAIHMKKLLWFTNLFLSHPHGLTKREIDQAWETSGYSNPNQVAEFKENGEFVSRISIPRTTFYRYLEEVDDTFNIKIVCRKGTNLWVIDQFEENAYTETIHMLREVLVMMDALNNDEIDLRNNISNKVYGIDRNPNVIRVINDINYETSDNFEINYNIIPRVNDQVIEQNPNTAEDDIDYLNRIIEAIKNKKTIAFINERSNGLSHIKPYGLKKFYRQWYVVGQSVVPEGIIAKVGAFSVDRLIFLRITEDTFEMPEDFNIEEYFADFVGPIVDFSVPKENILIKADKAAGRHLDFHRIHHSQKLLDVNDESVLFEFELRPTEGFYREILKYGSQIQVLRPVTVRAHIREEAEKLMLNNLNNL